MNKIAKFYQIDDSDNFFYYKFEENFEKSEDFEESFMRIKWIDELLQKMSNDVFL